MVKNWPASVGDVGSISGSGRSPGRGNGNPLQYSCLENSTDRGAWWGRKELDMTEHAHQRYMCSLPCYYVLSLSLKNSEVLILKS